MPASRAIGYDSRAILVDGQRTLITAATIHYPRAPRAAWPELFATARANGINTIETYVFWHLHEPERGRYDFTDRRDLPAFLALAQEYGLNVILRLGPYICAEINYGGFPAWLREIPGIQMRTWNEPYIREVEQWVRFLADIVRPYTAAQGGPIILGQIENEYNLIARTYGADGRRYLNWSRDLADSLGLGIPWIMCVGAADGVIETINGHDGQTDIPVILERGMSQPLIWTEAWTSWYDTWNRPHHRRSATSMAYGVAAFVAAGGTGYVYYPWYGGTNFAREAMFMQTTSYDYDAPVDEYGLPTTKLRHLGRLDTLLQRLAPTILAEERDPGKEIGSAIWRHDYGDITFICNRGTTGATLSDGDRSYTLAPQSVQIFEGETLLFDTAVIDPADVVTRELAPTGITLETWERFQEPLPHDWRPELRQRIARQETTPIQQLDITHDTTDYCWYCTTLEAAGAGTLTIAGGNDLFMIFVDGHLAGFSSGAPPEDYPDFSGAAFQHSFALNLPSGTHRLEILSLAIGMIKGDWQLGNQNMALERKGIWGKVRWNDQELPGDWMMVPGLVGEHLGLMDEGSRDTVWTAGTAPDAHLTWYRTTFTRPEGDEDLVLDMSGMSKGLLWVNGQCAGRYWLIKGTEPKDPKVHAMITVDSHDTYSQRYYRIPASWLLPENTLTVLEERGGDPATITVWCPRLVG